MKMLVKLGFGFSLCALAVNAGRTSSGERKSCSSREDGELEMKQMFNKMIFEAPHGQFGTSMVKVLKRVVPEATSETVEQGWSLLRESAPEINRAFAAHLPAAVKKIHAISHEDPVDDKLLLEITFSLVKGIFKDNPQFVEKFGLTSTDVDDLMQQTFDSVAKHYDYIIQNFSHYSRRLSDVQPSRRRSSNSTGPLAHNLDFAEMTANKGPQFVRKFTEVLNSRGMAVRQWTPEEVNEASSALTKLEHALTTHQRRMTSQRNSLENKLSKLTRASSLRNSVSGFHVGHRSTVRV